MVKKAIPFLIILLLWFISSVMFPFDAGFYHSLTLPFYTPNQNIITTIWLVIYILNSLCIFKIFYYEEFNNDYLYSLIINYMFNQLFGLFFFIFINLSLSLVWILFILSSSIYLYFETKKINSKIAIYLIPYLLWVLYLTIIFIHLYLIN